MAIQINGDHITFSSGRTAKANKGVIGLSPRLKTVSEGYDGGLDWTHPDDRYDEPEPDELMDEDMIELADHMVERWTQFKRMILRAAENELGN